MSARSLDMARSGSAHPALPRVHQQGQRREAKAQVEALVMGS